MPIFVANTFRVDHTKIAVSHMISGFDKPWKLQKAVPFVFLLSNREAFPHSYDTQYEMTISCLGHQGKFENMLCRHASQTNWYYAFDEAVYGTHIHNRKNQACFYIYVYEKKPCLDLI